MTVDRPIFDIWPALRDTLACEDLGVFPTPIESLAPVMRSIGAADAPVYAKRDDLSSSIYGGNKVRTLEVLFASAKQKGATHIYSTGAFGSNHATATVLHAPRVGLEPGVCLFPQPHSEAAAENLRTMLKYRPATRALLHWSSLPFGMYATVREHAKKGELADVMQPGGATPIGAMGYVSAAFEVARQVEAGEMPRPELVVVGVGSTCTSAGLLVGFQHAARLGVGFVDGRGNPAPPKLVSVRVTPWPVTSAVLIARLATQASQKLAELAGDDSLAISYRQLRAHLEVDGRFLGRGYGKPTETGKEAIREFAHIDGFTLDTTYSGKSAASVIDRVREGERRPILFWSTKSTSPMPEVAPEEWAWAPKRMRDWLDR